MAVSSRRDSERDDESLPIRGPALAALLSHTNSTAVHTCTRTPVLYGQKHVSLETEFESFIFEFELNNCIEKLNLNSII